MNKYQLPSIDILKKEECLVENDLSKYIERINNLLKDYKVKGKVIKTYNGPISLQFEIELSPGEKVDKLLDLEEEFKLFLGSTKVRIEGPRDKKTTIGINMPNPNKYNVSFREILEEEKNELLDMKIPFIIGKKDTGENIIGDLTTIQHLLLGGISGSGKTTVINSIIATILFTKTPDEVKLAIEDSKAVDLTLYNEIPHLMFPIVTDKKRATIILNKIVEEMNNRYKKFEETNTKTIEKYNEKAEEKIPYLVTIIDSLEEFLSVDRCEKESALYSLIRYGDEAGIHLILSTSINCLSAGIKDNINSRLCFQVRKSTESEEIMEDTGAELIDDIGECLYKPLYGDKVLAKVPLIPDDDVKKLVDWIIPQQQDKHNEIVTEEKQEESEEELYNEIVEFVTTTGKASASSIQRKFKLSYNKAARIINLLEERKVIGPSNGPNVREVLVKKHNKYCYNCGIQLIHDTNYCINCGTKLK